MAQLQGLRGAPVCTLFTFWLFPRVTSLIGHMATEAPGVYTFFPRTPEAGTGQRPNI